MSKPPSKHTSRIFSKLKEKITILSKPKDDRGSPAPIIGPPSQSQSNTRQADFPQETSVNQTGLVVSEHVNEKAPLTSAPLGKTAEVSETIHDTSKANQATDAGSTTIPPSITKTVADIDMSPISELWSEAYEELKVREESLVKDYEIKLCGSIDGLVASTTGNWLVKESEAFINWKVALNSLLWLNGKGKHVLPNKLLLLTTGHSWIWKVGPNVRIFIITESKFPSHEPHWSKSSDFIQLVRDYNDP
jgi:hypothetical protein